MFISKKLIVYIKMTPARGPQTQVFCQLLLLIIIVTVMVVVIVIVIAMELKHHLVTNY